MAAAKKYEVLIGHLVGLSLGDTVTADQIAEVGGDAAHLVKLGAIRVAKSASKSKGSEG